MPPVIAVHGLTKTFAIQRVGRERYRTFRDALASSATALFRPPRSGDVEEFLALDDVSFEVEAGDRLGIVGRNGAGKSTLLKVLSRITAPTRGRIEIEGRVGSLLEVGTGFHPELTGRENIYLSGVILGLSRAEVNRRFDEIVAFAEVEPFLDTPAKRYSSGMYLRLAFAVAAHLDPDILIVDEVLAVGDIAFQRKCLSRLDTVSREGRTVLFVSHNLEALSKLCNKGILLRHGRVECRGPIAKVVETYAADAGIAVDLSRRGPASGSGGATIESVSCSPARVGRMEPLTLSLRARLDPELQRGSDLAIGFGVDTMLGVRLFTCLSSWTETAFRADGPALAASCRLDFVPLVPGAYLVSAAILRPGVMLHHAEHCARFEVTDPREGYFVARAPDQGPVDLPYRFAQVPT